ncbi:MAG: F0F1 ATP synthase subunit B [Cellulosilyticaceae bacterium]
MDTSKIIEFSLPTLWEMFWQFLALFLIIWILKKLLFKPVMDFLEKRQEHIQKELSNAAVASKNAEELKNSYKEKLAHIEDEADSLLKEARQKALKREEEIVANAKKEAEAIKEKAMQDIALEQTRVKSEIKDQMIDVAGLMASKFVESTITEDKQEQLIDDMIKEMGDVSWLN